MINRFLILSLMFLMSKAGFAGNCSSTMVPKLLKSPIENDSNENIDARNPDLYKDIIYYICEFLPQPEWHNLILGISTKKDIDVVYLKSRFDDLEDVKIADKLDEITEFFDPNFTKIVDQDSLISLLTNKNTRKLVLQEWAKETTT